MNTDIVFIDPGSVDLRANNGIAYLISSLKKNGIKSRVFDLNSFNISDGDIIEKLIELNPEFTGISIKSAVAGRSIELIKKINQKFNTTFIVGGPHITIDGASFIKQTGLKNIFGLQYESEKSLPKLLSAGICNSSFLKNIPGLIYFDENNIMTNKPNFIENIDEIDFPDYSFIYPRFSNESPYQLITSRGCPYPCIFCCTPLLSGKRIRFRTPENVVEEIDRAIKDYNISSIEIQDDNFTFDIERAENICRLLLKRKIKIPWNCASGVRSDRLTDNLVRLMKESGCFSISVGIESANPNVLNINKKSESLYAIETAIDLIKKYDIRCYGFFIIGLPGSSFKTELESLQFLKNSKLDDGLFNIAVPYPATVLHDYLIENKYMISNFINSKHFGNDLNFNFEYPDFSAKEMKLAYFFIEYIRKNTLSFDLLTALQIEQFFSNHKFDKVLIIGINSLPNLLFSLLKLNSNVQIDLIINRKSENDKFIDKKIFNNIFYISFDCYEMREEIRKIFFEKYSLIIFIDCGELKYRFLYKILTNISNTNGLRIPFIKKTEKNKIKKKKIIYRFPDSTKKYYWTAHITMKCNYNCGYCIQKYNLKQYGLKNFSFTEELSGDKWIRFFESIEPKDRMLQVIEGGEPSLHPDFLEIVLNISDCKRLCINTNLSFDVAQLISKAHKRKSKIEIWTSFQPDFADEKEYIEKCLELKKINFLEDISIDVPAGELISINFPKYKKTIEEYKSIFEYYGLKLRLQETKGEFHGKINRIEDGHCFGKKETSTVKCNAGFVSIAPNGNIFNCNSKVFSGYKRNYGNIQNPESITFPESWDNCECYGKCDPCMGNDWITILKD